ncbi:MAG: hypothetical protein WAN11_02135 [Syntrophobacteraceae bacterium]
MSEEAANSKVSWVSVGLIIATIPVGLWLPQLIGLGWTWAINAIFIIVAIGSIGLNLGKGWTGVFIDPKTNMMSLSRLQIILWTWVILSSFITIALQEFQIPARIRRATSARLNRPISKPSALGLWTFSCHHCSGR